MSSTDGDLFIPDVTLVMGPLLLGYLTDALLFGILICQVYIFHLAYPNERVSVQCFVYTLLLLNAVQFALSTHNAWHFLSASWGNFENITNTSWSWIAVPLFTGLIGCPVQFYYAWRIWDLVKSRVLAGAIVILSLAQGVLVFIYAIRSAMTNDILQILTLFPLATAWLSISAFTNIFIAVMMVIFLQKSSTGPKSTDRVSVRITRLMIETGAVTALFSVVELILFVRYRDNLLYMMFALGLVKLYTNSLLCSLNSRSSGNLSQLSRKYCRCERGQSVNSTTVMISREIVTDVAMDDITKHPDEDNVFGHPRLEAGNPSSWSA
jgi:hypothetical protein